MVEEIIKKLVSHKLLVIDLNNILKNRCKGCNLHLCDMDSYQGGLLGCLVLLYSLGSSR